MLSERRLFFMHCPLFFFAFIILDEFFFIWKSKKWLLVTLGSNDGAGIWLGRLSIGRLLEVVV